MDIIGETRGMDMKKDYHFFATVSRMKYIHRWALMRNARLENLSEHSLEVAMITHALCSIGTLRYGKQLNAEKATLMALYHDCAEIVTGDLPTPVKYFSSEIQEAYHNVEEISQRRLLNQLPEDLQTIYEPILTMEDEELKKYVKAADKLSAYIKCIEEEKSGNTEFQSAAVSTKKILEQLCEELPEVKDFMEEFLPSYGNTLDELLENA